MENETEITCLLIFLFYLTGTSSHGAGAQRWINASWCGLPKGLILMLVGPFGFPCAVSFVVGLSHYFVTEVFSETFIVTTLFSSFEFIVSHNETVVLNCNFKM